MTNPYYTRAFNALAGSLARARQMINEFELIRSGFDGVDAKIAIALGDLTGALDYSSSTTYAKSDYVRYLGAVYRAKQATTGNLPTNTTYWQQVDIGAKDLTFIAGGIGLTLRASALAFKVDQVGANSPANITLTAYLHPALAGPASFSVVSGTATLTGTGNSRTLAYADMVSDSVTIRATVVDGLDTYTDDVTLVKVIDGAPGLRNRIINGDMSVSQRGTSGTTTSGGYTTDRWLVATTGTALVWVQAQTSSSLVGDYGFRALSWTGAAGNTGLLLLQRIEAINSHDMAGQTVTASFWMYQTTGVTQSVLPALVYSGGAADSWGSQTGIAALDAATSVPSGVWTKVTNRFAVPTAAITGLALYPWATSITFGSGSVGYISKVQLELGSDVTPFEQRTYGLELSLCQRYCLAAPAGTYVGQANSVSTTALTIYIPTPVSMRVAPSVSGFSGTSTFGLDGVGNFTSTSPPTLNGIGPGLCVLAQSGYTGLTAGRPGAFYNSATFVLSAEL